MKPKTQSCTVTAEQAGRADLVVQQLTSLPRRQIRGIFSQGGVSVNWTPCRDTFRRVAEGDLIEVSFDPQRRYHEEESPREDKFFKVVYEDAYLIVVEKAAGILSVPAPGGGGGGGPRESLIERISLRLTKGRLKNKAFACHRLDREVSGLLVVAKTQQIADLIREQFEERKPQREYLALVAGHPKDNEGTFRSYLATANNLDRYSVRKAGDDEQAKPVNVLRNRARSADKTRSRSRHWDDEQHEDAPRPRRPRKLAGDQGQLAITHYRVLKRLDRAALVRVRLETGRRNQIRVHFAEAGHPVLGDERYESALAKHPRWPHKRLALHATTLALSHPITRKPLHFDSPMPVEMARLATISSRGD